MENNTCNIGSKKQRKVIKIKIIGTKLPYDNLSSIRKRCEEISPNLIKENKIEKLLFEEIAIKV